MIHKITQCVDVGTSSYLIKYKYNFFIKTRSSNKYVNKDGQHYTINPFKETREIFTDEAKNEDKSYRSSAG